MLVDREFPVVRRPSPDREHLIVAALFDDFAGEGVGQKAECYLGRADRLAEPEPVAQRLDRTPLGGQFGRHRPPVGGRGMCDLRDLLRKQSGRDFVVESPVLKVQWDRSEEHTSELQSIMRTSYAV